MMKKFLRQFIEDEGGWQALMGGLGKAATSMVNPMSMIKNPESAIPVVGPFLGKGGMANQINQATAKTAPYTNPQGAVQQQWLLDQWQNQKPSVS